MDGAGQKCRRHEPECYRPMAAAAAQPSSTFLPLGDLLIIVGSVTGQRREGTFAPTSSQYKTVSSVFKYLKLFNKIPLFLHICSFQ